MYKSSSLPKQLFSMTWPMLLGVVALMGFQLADSFFISLLGTPALAALGFTMPINQLLIGVQVGIGIAATALISRSLGADNRLAARQMSRLILIVGATVMAALVAVIFFIKAPILNALGAEASVYPYTDAYWLPWLASTAFHAFLYFAMSISRAYGDAKLPGFTMVLTSVLNIILDPIYIFTFKMGIAGAAYATITACLVGISLLFFRIKNRHWVASNFHAFSIKDALIEIQKISAPAMLSQLMPGMAALFATRIVALYGASAIAAWALGTRLETFSIVIVLALTMSMPPMLGHMLGAKNILQVHQIMRLAAGFILVFQTFVAIFWWGLKGILVPTLTQETQTALYLNQYMLWVPLSYAPLGVCILMVSSCNALGMPLRAVWISVLRLFAFYLPAVGIGAYLAGIEGIYLGVCAGNLVAGVTGWQLYKKGLLKLEASV